MLRNGEGVQEDGLKVNDRPETAGLAPNTPHTCNLSFHHQEHELFSRGDAEGMN